MTPPERCRNLRALEYSQGFGGVVICDCGEYLKQRLEGSAAAVRLEVGVTHSFGVLRNVLQLSYSLPRTEVSSIGEGERLPMPLCCRGQDLGERIDQAFERVRRAV